MRCTRLSLVGALVALLSLLSSNYGSAQPRGLPAGVIHIDRAYILDAAGFETPMAASTLFLPRGWQTQGGVVWGNQFMCTNGYNFNWTATSPDGTTTINVLPQERWETNSMSGAASTPGCQAAPYRNTQQYLQSVVQRWKPGARVLDYRVRQDLQNEYAHLNQTTPSAMGETRAWVDAGEILFAFDDRGADMRGSIAAVVLFSASRMSGGAALPAMEFFSGFAMPAYGVTAPNGRLNLGFFEAIRRSVQTNPQWQARLNNHNAAIARVNIEENRKRAAIVAETNAEIARIRDEAWSAAQESSDRRVREFGELMRGVETYDDTNAPGGQVELSNLYDHAWRLDDGSYVLTNNINFEPGRDLGVAGNRLEATR